MSSVQDVPKAPLSAADPLPSGELAQGSPQAPFPDGAVGSGYDPSGRRDPFAPVIQDLQLGKVDENLPPLQRVTLTELNLIAIVCDSPMCMARSRSVSMSSSSIRKKAQNETIIV
ncbi:MAG: hypothetical protein HP494_14580 [Nitrospira sp.]|nr:hypothetical protein [Nitrospira sp.]